MFFIVKCGHDANQQPQAAPTELLRWLDSLFYKQVAPLGLHRPTPAVFGLAFIHKIITITLSRYHQQTYINTHQQTRINKMKIPILLKYKISY